jgi:hypothetical protein
MAAASNQSSVPFSEIQMVRVDLRTDQSNPNPSTIRTKRIHCIRHAEGEHNAAFAAHQVQHLLNMFIQSNLITVSCCLIHASRI